MKSLRALVQGLVDYAGVFLPAQLDMTAAVAEYARERRTDDAWMLARFIVPVGRLAEFEAARDQLPRADVPWPLSVLAGGDYEAAVVPPKARAMLARFDERSQHYEVRVDRPATS